MSSNVTLKGGRATVVNLTIDQWLPDAVKHDLQNLVRDAPQLITGMPIVILLKEQCAASADAQQVQELVDWMREHDINPFMVKAPSAWLAINHLKGMTLMALEVEDNAKQTLSEINHKTVEPFQDSKTVETESPVQRAMPMVLFQTAMIVDTPVRSGQQIYAQDRDLIILANVNRGAEIMSDGHIIVMGDLKGRALAGLQGRDDAIIMAKTLDSELMAIDGQYVLRDDIPASVNINKYSLVSIKKDILTIENL